MFYKIGKIIAGVLLALAAAFWLWLFISWFDIIADNTSPEPEHWKYNAFVLFTEAAEKETESEITEG